MFFLKDFLRFSDMLTMEPPLSRYKNGFKFKSKLTEQDILSLRESVGQNFDKIQIILKQIPNYMLLVLRYKSLKIIRPNSILEARLILIKFKIHF